MRVKDGSGQRSATTLSSWAEDEIKANRGVSPEIRDIKGSLVRGANRTLHVYFDQPPLGHGDPTLHFDWILWELRGNLYGGELSYRKGDPNGATYERILREVVSSFRPI